LNTKILIITSEFPPLPGGIGNHAYHLAKGLLENKKEVTVLTDQRSKKINDDVAFDEKLSFKVIRIKRYSFYLLTYFLRFSTILKVLIIDKPSVVIASGKFSLWLGAISTIFFQNKQYIAVLHGSEIFAGGFLSQTFTKWSLSKFDKLIAVSQFTKELALRQKASLTIKVINNGFSFTAVKDTPTVVKRNPNILTVGNLTYRKGQQNGIVALPLLKTKFPDIHYHIVGTPTEQKKFTDLAATLGVLDKITFHGVLSDTDLKKIVSSSDVFFMLSDHLKNGDVEGFGIAILEANSLGLPAIGSRNSGIADAIKEGYSGRLVSPHDSSEILSALEAIMNDYDNYSAQAKQWSEQFDWAIVIKQYLQILDR
jgi:phosphatidylinositol alpha-1,6-mannosyltransferase